MMTSLPEILGHAFFSRPIADRINGPAGHTGPVAPIPPICLAGVEADISGLCELALNAHSLIFLFSCGPAGSYVSPRLNEQVLVPRLPRHCTSADKCSSSTAGEKTIPWQGYFKLLPSSEIGRPFRLYSAHHSITRLSPPLHNF